MKQSRERGGESTGGMLPAYQGHDAVSFVFFSNLELLPVKQLYMGISICSLVQKHLQA